MKTSKLAVVPSFLIFTYYVLPFTVNAQSPTPTLRPRQEFRQERRDAIKETRTEIKEDRQELKATVAQQRKTLWTELKKKQVNLVTDRIIKELTTRYDIVLKLKTKIADRITAKSSTHDTSAASAKLALFSDAQYQTDLATLKTKISAITSSDTPKALLPGIREAANVVRKDLRDLHQFLVDVMKLVATSPKK